MRLDTSFSELLGQEFAFAVVSLHNHAGSTCGHHCRQDWRAPKPDLKSRRACCLHCLHVCGYSTFTDLSYGSNTGTIPSWEASRICVAGWPTKLCCPRISRQHLCSAWITAWRAALRGSDTQIPNAIVSGLARPSSHKDCECAALPICVLALHDADASALF